MERTLINHPKLSVRQKTGREGPSWDPYHYDEYHITTPKGSLVLHDGLLVYAELNGERHVATGKDYNSPAWRNKFAVELTGYNFVQLQRFSDSAKARCPKGGYHDTRSERGYPGETFEVCSKCNKVTDSYFCESAVI